MYTQVQYFSLIKLTVYYFLINYFSVRLCSANQIQPLFQMVFHFPSLANSKCNDIDYYLHLIFLILINYPTYNQ